MEPTIKLSSSDIATFYVDHSAPLIDQIDLQISKSAELIGNLLSAGLGYVPIGKAHFIDQHIQDLWTSTNSVDHFKAAYYYIRKKADAERSKHEVVKGVWNEDAQSYVHDAPDDVTLFDVDYRGCKPLKMQQVIVIKSSDDIVNGLKHFNVVATLNKWGSSPYTIAIPEHSVCSFGGWRIPLNSSGGYYFELTSKIQAFDLSPYTEGNAFRLDQSHCLFCKCGDDHCLSDCVCFYCACNPTRKINHHDVKPLYPDGNFSYQWRRQLQEARTKYTAMNKERFGNAEIVATLLNFYTLSFLSGKGIKAAKIEFNRLSLELQQQILNYLLSSCLGEARHALNRCSITDATPSTWPDDMKEMIYYLTNGVYSDHGSERMYIWQTSDLVIKRYGLVRCFELLVMIFSLTWIGGGYGGEKWKNIAQVGLEQVKGQYVVPVVFIDHVVDLVHNGGWALNKYYVDRITNPNDQLDIDLTLATLLDGKRDGDIIAMAKKRKAHLSDGIMDMILDHEDAEKEARKMYGSTGRSSYTGDRFNVLTAPKEQW